MKKFRNFLLDTKIDFMKVHKIALILSIISIIASIILVFVKGLNLGIDFSGGVLMEIRIENVTQAQLRHAFDGKLKDVQIQIIGQNDYLLRVAKNEEKNTQETLDLSQSPEKSAQNLSQNQTILKIQAILSENFKDIEYRKIDYVGPQIGSELIKNGFLALLLSFIFIMIYIWVRFDWQFGVGGIFALVHDAVLTMGFYAISNIEFNLTSIAAILTVIGFSINDSVVIYDRIRENMRRFKKMDLADLINSSANSTLSRTLLTSGTTLLSLLALILFGGEVLKSFSTAAFFGIFIGTYSSIYISAPILLYFDPRNKSKKDRI